MKFKNTYLYSFSKFFSAVHLVLIGDCYKCKIFCSDCYNSVVRERFKKFFSSFNNSEH
jgi:hypothetical protein